MPATYEKIATVQGNGSSQILTFNNIPQTFTDLAIHGVGTFVNGDDLIYMLINNNLNNQNAVYWYNDPFTGGSISSSSPLPYLWRQNNWGSIKVDILSYRESGHKNITFFLGANVEAGAGGGRVIHGYTNWADSAAISRIDLSMYNSGSQWDTGTILTLYGIKRA